MTLSRNQKIILFLSILILGGIALAGPVEAQLGTGIFDYESKVLDALDFIDQAILRFLTWILLLGFGSSAFVAFSAGLLEWAYQLPLHLHNPLVLGGWSFVSGLVNLFFILAFVYVALAYILRVESLQIKKTLPRLIAVVLLVNFSLLIVGVFVDMAQFFMNTFMNAYGTDFIDKAMLPLKQSAGTLLMILGTTVFGYISTAFLPFGTIVSLTGITIGLFTTGLLGNFFSIVLLIIFNLVMGAMFLIYAILFIFRIAALWLLSIFAPLAFLAFVFPQTRKYASKWVKATFQWAFLGVVALFLLGLVTSMFAQVFAPPPEISISGIQGVPAFELPPSLYNYLFLIVFLGVAFYASIKYVPAGADRVINFAKGQLKSMGGITGLAKKSWKAAGEITKRAVPEEKAARARRGGRAILEHFEKAPLLRYAIPRKTRMAVETGAAIKRQQKRLSEQSSDTLAHRIAYKDLKGTPATAALREIIDRGDVQDLFRKIQERFKKLSPEKREKETKKLLTPKLEEAYRGGELGHILRRSPRLARIAAGQVGAYRPLSEKKAVEKAVSEARPGYLSSWEREELEDEDVVRAALAKGRSFWNAVDRHIKDGMDTATKTIDRVFSEFKDAAPEGYEPHNWEQFGEHIKDQYGFKGYFESLGYRGFKARGWREAKYLSPEERTSEEELAYRKRAFYERMDEITKERKKEKEYGKIPGKEKRKKRYGKIPGEEEE